MSRRRVREPVPDDLAVTLLRDHPVAANGVEPTTALSRLHDRQAGGSWTPCTRRNDSGGVEMRTDGYF